MGRMLRKPKPIKPLDGHSRLRFGSTPLDADSRAMIDNFIATRGATSCPTRKAREVGSIGPAGRPRNPVRPTRG
jgi:hypothetical protein